jgi:chromosome segregation ATPase
MDITEKYKNLNHA